jgi:class 3 adenylate cyclase
VRRDAPSALETGQYAPFAPAMSRLTLTFLDPALEAAYRTYFFDSKRRFLAVGLVISTLVTAAFGLVDKVLAPDDYEALWLIRYGITVPVLLAALPLVFWPPAYPFMRRRAQEMVLLLLTVVTTSLIVLSARFIRMPDDSGVIDPDAVSRIFAGLAGWTLVMLVALGVTRVRFLYALPIAAAAVVSAVVVPLRVAHLDPTIVAVGLVVIITITSVGLVMNYSIELYERRFFEKTHALARSQERTVALLESMLPRAIARALESGTRTIAERHDEASVLFADLVGFTRLAERLPPEQLVGLLDRTFARFDEVVARHDVEKVKTIGDAYLVVAGVPDPCEDHAAVLADVALALMAETAALARETGFRLELRAGIHTGPLLAGVIGTTKPAYDVWGDTVNTAARMESHGEPGRVQVTAAVVARLAGRFECVPRGTIDVKGKGALETWWLGARLGARSSTVQD